jgi:hypothetical protein
MKGDGTTTLSGMNRMGLTHDECHAPVSRRLEPVFEEYAKALGIPMRVHVPVNHFSPPWWGGGLHLHVFALPARPHWFSLWPITPRVEMRAVFSLALADKTNNALDPRQLFSQGALKYDQQGHAVAGILGENIYVLFDLLGQPEELVPLMLRRILDLCLEGLTESLSHWTGRLPHQLEITLHRLSHSTTLASLDHSVPPEDSGTQDPPPRVAGDPVDVFNGRMAAVEENLKELSRQMGSQTRLLRNCRERLATLKQAEQSTELLERELDGLLSIPEIREVQVLEDRLRVFTDTVDTVVASKRYRLGRFRLDIRFNGDVDIKNLTRAYGYYDHPHVWNAKPCLGNIHQSVLKLVSEFQWVATAELLLEYLKTVNPNGWYTPIDHWEELQA